MTREQLRALDRLIAQKQRSFRQRLTVQQAPKGGERGDRMKSGDSGVPARGPSAVAR